MTCTASAARSERPPIPLPNGPNSPACPKCGGAMWDNRTSKRNPRAPDYKCRNRACDGVLWPGQRGRSAIPALPAPRLAAVPEDEPDRGDNADAQRLPPLRRKYLDLTDFVIHFVRPKYEENELECRPDTIAAIAATLYIAETRREGL